MKQYAVVFDLDGTLVDSAPDLIATLNHMLALDNHPPVAESPVRPLISEGARAMLSYGFELAGAPRNETELDELTARFVTYYADNIAVHSHPFPGLLAALDDLSDRGTKLGVCTNKREYLSKKLLSSLDLNRYFQTIVGVDTLEVRKPHPGHLLGTLERLGVDRERAVMIGDSETDIKTAKAAGVPVIALDFGYSREPIASYHPDAILSHYDQLLDTLNDFIPLY